MKKRRPVDTAEPSINITPLIDVVFVILIAFILIAPMLEKEAIRLPPGAHHESLSVEMTGPITIQVRADNTIIINKRAVPTETLERELSALKNTHPTAKPQVLHDKRAQFGTYQTLKNALEQTGFSEMELVLEPT